MAEVSTPVAEVQSSLGVPWELVEKVEKDFSREEWEVELRSTMLLVDLVEVEVLMEMEEVQGEEEGTLEEAVEIMRLIRVEAVEDLIMLDFDNKVQTELIHLYTQVIISRELQLTKAAVVYQKLIGIHVMDKAKI